MTSVCCVTCLLVVTYNMLCRHKKELLKSRKCWSNMVRISNTDPVCIGKGVWLSPECHPGLISSLSSSFQWSHCFDDCLHAWQIPSVWGSYQTQCSSECWHFKKWQNPFAQRGCCKSLPSNIRFVNTFSSVIFTERPPNLQAAHWQEGHCERSYEWRYLTYCALRTF
jgi:hypothetical protein